MFVAEIHWGVFIAKGTNCCIFYEKVNFDRNFWLPIFEKLEHVCDKYLMQELAHPRVQPGLDRTILTSATGLKELFTT